MGKRPKLSIIMVARNDDYGKNFLNRITTSVRALIYLTNRYRSNFELVIIDYNPPPDKELLAQTLSAFTTDNIFLTIRFIVIPNTFHVRVAQESKRPLLEYLAKNIGIRRAQAEFILTTNPDIIFDDTIIEFLTEAQLDKNSFYRINRYDLPMREFDTSTQIPEIIKQCRQRTTRIWTKDGLIYTSFRRWFKRFLNKPLPKNLFLCPWFNPLRKIKAFVAPKKLHEAASGDFLLAHRNAWQKVRGFDQLPFSSFIDGYNVHLFYCAGLEQKILPFPIYHINHDTSNTMWPMLDYEIYLKNSARMLKTKIPYKIYPENWGFPEENFPETIIQ